MFGHSLPFTLLLVEDDPADLLLLKKALRQWTTPITLVHARDGVECLEFLRQSGETGRPALRPNLILMDLNMPRMNGKEALGAIRADQKLRSIPVVVLSTSTAEQDVHKSYDLGANSFISKPTEFSHFMDVIRTLEEYWVRSVTLPH